MAARDGMVNLISQWRRLVSDVGTVVFTDDRAQEILDSERLDFYGEALTVQPRSINGSVHYVVYQSDYKHIEGTASGTVAFRLYNSLGSAVTGTYTLDANLGVFTFSADQAGSARYLDARSFDLNGAAATGWRERAGLNSASYDFKVEGRSYSRSQMIKHCLEMSVYYEGLRSNQKKWSSSFGIIERSDMLQV